MGDQLLKSSEQLAADTLSLHGDPHGERSQVLVRLGQVVGDPVSAPGAAVVAGRRWQPRCSRTCASPRWLIRYAAPSLALRERVELRWRYRPDLRFERQLGRPPRRCAPHESWGIRGTRGRNQGQPLRERDVRPPPVLLSSRGSYVELCEEEEEAFSPIRHIERIRSPVMSPMAMRRARLQALVPRPCVRARRGRTPTS